MALKSIATQAELSAFQDALSRLSGNYDFHVNEAQPPFKGCSLSEAHGIDLIVGTTDADGNDVSAYEDSNGDRVSDAGASGKPNFVRFIVNGQPYYAPLQETTDAGQDRAAPLDSFGAALDVPGGTALVTEYVVTEQVEAQNVDSRLREHTQQPAQQAHTAMTVTAEVSYDSAGHRVGTHLLRLQYGGLVYQIPVSSRLGGPIQGIRLTPFSPSSHIFRSSSPNSALAGAPFTVVYAGTRPVSITWEVSGDGTYWTPLVNDPTGANYTGLSGWAPGAQFAWDAAHPETMTVRYMSPTENSWCQLYIRCVVSNVLGPVTSNTVHIWIYDRTGSWLCTVAYDKGYLPRKIYLADMAYTQRHVPEAAKVGYALWAWPLSRQMYRHTWLLLLFLPIIRAWTYHMAYRHGTVKTDNLFGRLIFLTALPLCTVIGHVVLAAEKLFLQPKTA